MTFRSKTLLAAIIVLFCAVAQSATCQDTLTNANMSGGYYQFATGQYAPNGWSPCSRNGVAGCSWRSTFNNGTSDNPNYVHWVKAYETGREVGICQVVRGLKPNSWVKFNARAQVYSVDAHIRVAITPGEPTSTIVPGYSVPVVNVLNQYVDYPGDPSRLGVMNWHTVTGMADSTGCATIYLWLASFTPNVIAYFDQVEVTAAPFPVTDLRVTDSYADSLQLTWTVPGWARYYEIRHSSSPITEANWDLAYKVDDQLPPKAGTYNTTQSTWARNLSPGQTCYFAMKVIGENNSVTTISNNATGTTTSAGTAPYWAHKQKNMLGQWYSSKVLECTEALTHNTNPDDPFSWFYQGWDPDVEHQPGIAALLQIVRDPWMLDFLARLSDQVWILSFRNVSMDKNYYKSTNPHQIIPAWNEAHHGGELSWNGVALTALDYNNEYTRELNLSGNYIKDWLDIPTQGRQDWADRLALYCEYLEKWTGLTGLYGQHRHFKSFWMKLDQVDLNHLSDMPENRRHTRAAEYLAWRNPQARMSPNGPLVSDFLNQLELSSADHCMEKRPDKPLGVWPAEIVFDTDQSFGKSGYWWKQADAMWDEEDWRRGWVVPRDAYYAFMDRYMVTGDKRFMDPVRETLNYFCLSPVAKGGIPPMYMYKQWQTTPDDPWPDSNDPYGGYQALIDLQYRQLTGDSRFDSSWLNHAGLIWEKIPPAGDPRYGRMFRSTHQWDVDSPTVSHGPDGLYFLAWTITKDKKWLNRSLDEMRINDQFMVMWFETMYTGMSTVSINRLPLQPITWNNTEKFTDFATLVLDWDYSHIRWLNYNFSPDDKPMSIWLWSLKPGRYILRYGPDSDYNNRLDCIAGSSTFTVTQRRQELPIMLPSDQMWLFEIMPAEQNTVSQVKVETAENTPVTLGECVVSAAFDGFFYVEDADRTSGLRIESASPVKSGDRVPLQGYVGSISGERCLKCIDVSVISSNNPVPKPVYMTNRQLGGGANGLQKGVVDWFRVPIYGTDPLTYAVETRLAGGLNNIGLLIRTTGKVVGWTDDGIYIDDGSGCTMNNDQTGIKVVIPADPATGIITKPEIGTWVSVTGVSSCEIPSGESEAMRVVRALKDSVVPLSPQ